MKEIEVKILEVDRPQLEAKLIDLGASKHFDDRMEALFFDYPDGRITATGELCRIRREGKQVQLTYKQPISQAEAKIMKELELTVSNQDTMMAILTALGMKVINQTIKHRTEYILNDVSIVFDKYAGALAHIPEFIEVEAPNLARMEETIELIGFKLKDAQSWHTYDLVKHYENKNRA